MAYNPGRGRYVSFAVSVEGSRDIFVEARSNLEAGAEAMRQAKAEGRTIVMTAVRTAGEALKRDQLKFDMAA